MRKDQKFNKEQPYMMRERELDAIAYVESEPGASSREVIKALGLDENGACRGGRSKLERLIRVFRDSGEVFFQKDGVTLKWYPPIYAKKNNVPEFKISPVQTVEDAEMQPLIRLYNKANSLMPAKVQHS